MPELGKGRSTLHKPTLGLVAQHWQGHEVNGDGSVCKPTSEDAVPLTFVACELPKTPRMAPRNLTTPTLIALFPWTKRRRIIIYVI
jgi:hypothetical protein